MLRAGLIILVMVAGAIQPAAHASCAGEDATHSVLARQGLRQTENRFPTTFPAMLRQVIKDSGDEGPSSDETFEVEGVEFMVFVADDYRYPCGAPLLDITIAGVDTGRIDPLDFPWFQGIDMVTETYGGSGNAFGHRIFARTGDKFADVTPSPREEIGHSNMGGFFFGPLGKGRGNGFVIWEADWTDGIHYDPHPYKATFYEWDGVAFREAGKASDPKKYAITDAAPDFIGLPNGTRFSQTMPYTTAHYALRDPLP
jgi:hypothetical protein